MSDESSWPRVLQKDVHSFVHKCLRTVGAADEHAENLATVLSLADVRGHYSHGINRLGLYVRDLKNGFAEKDGKPTILKEGPATAWVDGNQLLGPTVGKFCMEVAIKKAKEIGIGFVVAKGSNHYGIAGWYPMMAIEQGLIGFSFTNTSPCIVPTRARQPHLGTNPISMAAKAGNDSFVLDMATSTVALGKVEVAKRKGTSVPTAWGCDGTGLASTEPSKIIEDGGLFPIGGSETTGGYKGSGLSFMVEILCGVLGGASFGPYVRQWKDPNGQSGDLGQCFIAVNPDHFAPGFEDRLGDFITTTRNLNPSEGNTEVLIAGDPERIRIRDAGENGGIPYHPNVLDAMDEIADDLKIERMPRSK